MSVALALREWTLEQLHSLPDDGNKYELLCGDLLVTPAPTPAHELILARLDATLMPFVVAQGLGYVYRPRAVIRQHPRSEVEPDLFVSHAIHDYDAAPVPSLVVEVLSPYTRKRDLEMKRTFYLDTLGITEYWIVDPEAQAVIVARKGAAHQTITGALSWHPPQSRHPLTFEVAKLFA